MLVKATPLQKRVILKTANNSQISALCEIYLNILAGNLSINIKRLKIYKNTIHKKALLANESGEFLPALALIILSALVGMVLRVIGDKVLKKRKINFNC